MKRENKEQIVGDVAEITGRAGGLFFTDFTGLTVEQMTELRREFRKSGVQYRVVKNTLIRKALEKLGGFDSVISKKLVGPTGVAFAFDDPIAPARIIQKFADKSQKLKLKICVIEKEVFDGSRLKEIASMLCRKELMASIAGSVQAPLAGVPQVLYAVLRDLVSVIGEIEKKKAA